MAFWAIALSLIGPLAQADNIINPVAGTTTELRTLQDGLLRRDLLIIAPRDVEGLRPAIVLLSYLGGSPGPMANLTHAARLARDYQFYVLLPESIMGRWNFNPLSGLVNDVEFLDQVLDVAIADLPIDPDRIFMAGYSNGGLMTYAYACARAHRLAGAATVGSSFRRGMQRWCSPDASLPLLQFHGDADPVVPFDGNLFTLTAEQTTRFWVQANGCGSQPERSALPDRVDDGTQAVLDTFSNCRNNATVRLYTIKNGGHTWPGLPEVQPALGRTGQDIDATAIMGRIFSELSRP